MIISAIVAMADNRVIGNNNQLPWRLPADLKHFKRITTGHPIVMGRKTYESIGRPLPNRTNIILTRDPDYQAPGCVVVTSFEAAIHEATHLQADELFVIGGSEIYQQTLPLIERLYLTMVHYLAEGDAFFPALDLAEWRQLSSEAHSPDAENAYAYHFLVLEKRQKIDNNKIKL